MAKYHLDADALRREVAGRLTGLSMIGKTKRIAWFYAILSMNYLNVGPLGESGEIIVYGSRSDCIKAYQKSAKRKLGRKTLYRYFDILQSVGLVTVAEDGRVILNLPTNTTQEIQHEQARQNLETGSACVRSSEYPPRRLVSQRQSDVAGRIVAG